MNEPKVYTDLATAAGFKKAGEKAQEDYALAKKLLLAYADYQIVTKKNFDDFNKALKAKTHRSLDRYTQVWKEVKLQRIENYEQLPPVEVLELVAAAKKTELFDKFEVAYIANTHYHRDPDPIVFGSINGCSDLFFIAQWGDDMKLTDLLGETNDDQRSGETSAEG